MIQSLKKENKSIDLLRKEIEEHNAYKDQLLGEMKIVKKELSDKNVQLEEIGLQVGKMQ